MEVMAALVVTEVAEGSADIVTEALQAAAADIVEGVMEDLAVVAVMD